MEKNFNTLCFLLHMPVYNKFELLLVALDIVSIISAITVIVTSSGMTTRPYSSNTTLNACKADWPSRNSYDALSNEKVKTEREKQN